MVCIVRRVPSLVVFCFLAPLIAHAQSTNASLSGRLTDSSKARIAGARVAATDIATNIRNEVTTNTSGEYYLPNLAPGTYRMEVEKPGFQKMIRPNVILHVQDVLSIDFEMRVGSASERITVEGGAPLQLCAWKE